MPRWPALLLLAYSQLSVATFAPDTKVQRRGPHSLAKTNVPEAGFNDPRDGGGNLLTDVPDTYPAGLGEPINIIISAKSDAAVLVDQSDDGGLRNYFQSLSFSGECLGQHLGSDQGANLGDGNGIKNETAVLRYNYGDPYTGTCTETVEGGNHFRYWVQNGPKNNSGAIFMALSYEQPISAGHDIIPNGYDLARDWLVGNATAASSIISTLDLAVPIQANLTANVSASPGNLPSLSGSTSSNGYTYSTKATYLTGLLSNTSVGINHNDTVPVDGRPAIDGLVSLLEVTITSKPASAAIVTAVPRLASLLMICIISPTLWHLLF